MVKDPNKITDIDINELEEKATDDPFLAKILSEALEAKQNGEKEKHFTKIAEAAQYISDKEPAKAQGFTMEDDPTQGYTEDFEKIREFNEKYPMPEAKVVTEPSIDIDHSDTPAGEAPEPAAEQSEEPVAENPEEPAAEQPEEPVAENPEEPVAEQPVRPKRNERLADIHYDEDFPSRRERLLKEAFEETEKLRELYKDPGNVRYRLLSVYATEMHRIDQSGEPNERIKRNNQEIEKAIKEAYGSEELDKYAADTLAAAQLYLSEVLIGDDADKVSIGTTGTVMNQTGQIATNPESYNNLVVVRWTKNNLNHVVVFSPNEDTGVYALVDDSMGDSWKKEFLKAGAVDGEERKNMIVINHMDHDEWLHHELSIQKLAIKIMAKELEALDSDDWTPEEQLKIQRSIGAQFTRLPDKDEVAKYAGDKGKRNKITQYADEVNQVKKDETEEA